MNLRMKTLTIILILITLFMINTANYLIFDHFTDATQSKSTRLDYRYSLRNLSHIDDLSEKVAIYLVPHADDETLTFGIPILNDIHEGKKVFLVLLTDGVGSYARDIINGKSDKYSRKYHRSIMCRIHHVVHNPIKEHYQDHWITNAVMKRARNEEFIAASGALGIPRNQLEFMAMEKLTYGSVRSVLLQLKQYFPNATFKSMSPIDGHSQHALTGEVLAGMYANHELSHIQNNFGSIYTDRIKYGNRWPGRKFFLEDPQDAVKLLRAMYAYGDWDPKHGKYAIGYHSVYPQFAMLKRNMYTKIFYIKQL